MNKMIVSSSMLKGAIEKYQNTQRVKERYKHKSGTNQGVNTVVASFVLLVSLVFFILEVFVLYHAIGIAINCTQSGTERIVNIVLAVTFTMPYVMSNLLFNKCAKDTLRSTSMLPAGISSSVI